MEQITVRGIPFDNVTMREAVARADALLQEDGVSVVVTPNAEIAYDALLDASLMETIRGASLILPDGAGILRAAEILGTPLKEKVAGVEFGEAMIKHAAEAGIGVFLLGGKPTVAERAAERLRVKYTSLTVCGTHDGYFEKTGAENDAVIEEINASGAALIFVCLGAPLQENWIFANKDALRTVRLAACLGGSLDIYAGTAKRAPRLFILLRLEWLWRLLREPKRLGRMMRLPKYIRGARKEARTSRRKEESSQ